MTNPYPAPQLPPGQPPGGHTYPLAPSGKFLGSSAKVFPGDTVESTVLIDIPTNASLDAVEFKKSLFDEGAVVSLK